MEQVVDSITNTAKISENNFSHFSYPLFVANLKLLLGYFTRKLLSKDLSVTEKASKNTSGKSIGNVDLFIAQTFLKVLHMDLNLSCTSEKTKVQHQILTALDDIMGHKQSIQNQLVQ